MLVKALNVFYVVDKNFIIHFTVSLTSLLENNRDLDISVYVIHDISDYSILKKITDFFAEHYGVRITLIELNGNVFSELPCTPYITRAAYFRLLLADIIPINILTGLYLDCDTIVTGSLKRLSSLNFLPTGSKKQYCLMAVEDIKAAENLDRLSKIGIESDLYFNSGVMLLNLKKWRLENASGGLIKAAEQYRNHLKWHDQDVLNIYFKNQCGNLECTFNTLAHQKLSKLPLIIHFSGPSKPWHYVYNGPYKSLYWKYLKLTPFKDEKFERITFTKVKQKYSHLIKKFAKIES